MREGNPNPLRGMRYGMATRDDSRAHGGEASANRYHLASDDFDGGLAIARLHNIFDQVYGKSWRKQKKYPVTTPELDWKD